MNLLAMEQVSKTYGEKNLLCELSFGIEEGEKIGLLGLNGSGKSTFLKLIAGREEPDRGNIIWNKNLHRQYLPQEPLYNPQATVLDTVLSGDAPGMDVLQRYHSLLTRIDQTEESEALHQELLQVGQQMEALDAWTLESDAKSILNRLGIHGFEDRMGLLSGGQRKRVALAAALMNAAGLLILDEPTNHLDNQAIDWLEEYLQRFHGALLMVTHDRYFLERVTSRIIELDRTRLYSYPGNYSAYLERKLEREAIEASMADKKQGLLRKELAWIRKGARARSTKQKARIQRFEKLQDDQELIKGEKLQISSAASRLGKKTIILQDVSHGFQGENLIQDYSCILARDERMGLVGANGVGKSTLLRIMCGELIPEMGTVEIGSTVKIGYFPQESTGLPEDMRVIDYIREAGEYLQAGKKLLSASQMLETFLFTPAAQWTTLQKLSGGEKRRLHLLRILMGAPNVLLLDEPGNDLDIETLTILEDYLDDFPGAVITVSHDRYFLDRICEKILAFEGQGMLREYPGNYSDYWRYSIREQNSKPHQGGEPSRDSKPDGRDDRKAKPVKFSFREQKEFAEIDERIAAVEDELKNLNGKIDQAASDYQELERLLALRQDVNKSLDDLLERWTYLNELAEAIEKQRRP
ncbi:MAG TPA: ABC-F family ATP-binding cassette domain-containing protein [Syntrophomonadaceae bacterium]|nr:ABC-F family ATP-binding cassette domain-containing protein [Syntrophomonadaceae bacterium]